MQVIVNGEPREVPPRIRAAELIDLLGLGERRLALEVNEEIVPRSRYGALELRPGDRIEIVHAIGGG